MLGKMVSQGYRRIEEVVLSDGLPQRILEYAPLLSDAVATAKGRIASDAIVVSDVSFPAEQEVKRIVASNLAAAITHPIEVTSAGRGRSAAVRQKLDLDRPCSASHRQ